MATHQAEDLALTEILNVPHPNQYVACRVRTAESQIGVISYAQAVLLSHTERMPFRVLSAVERILISGTPSELYKDNRVGIKPTDVATNARYDMLTKTDDFEFTHFELTP